MKIRRNFCCLLVTAVTSSNTISTVNEFSVDPDNCLSSLRNHRLPVWTKLLIFFAGLSAGLCLSLHGEPLRIVVAGDGRAEEQSLN